jgi:3-hydroxyacyl-[acyl-carrier-protein] dehydratase
MITPAEIRRLLPHRFPMLLVDRVLDAVPGQSLTALKAVTLNEPWYARLAPDATDRDTRYPESLLIESWGQSAGLLSLISGTDDLDGAVMLFGSASGVAFHRRVQPGDLLEHRVRLDRRVGDTVLFTGDSRVGGDVVLTVDRMVMAFRPAAALSPAHT